MSEAIRTRGAPAFPSLLSQGVLLGGGRYDRYPRRMLITSGQVGVVPETAPLVLEDGVAAQTTRALGYIAAIVNTAGGSVYDIVNIDVFHTNPDDSGTIDTAYTEFFADAQGQPRGSEDLWLPAHTRIGASFLRLGAAVEVRAQAYILDGPAVL